MKTIIRGKSETKWWLCPRNSEPKKRLRWARVGQPDSTDCRTCRRSSNGGEGRSLSDDVNIWRTGDERITSKEYPVLTELDAFGIPQ